MSKIEVTAPSGKRFQYHRPENIHVVILNSDKGASVYGWHRTEAAADDAAENARQMWTDLGVEVYRRTARPIN